MALRKITRMKADIEHYEFSITKSADGPTIDFEIRGTMIDKGPRTERTVSTAGPQVPL